MHKPTVESPRIPLSPTTPPVSPYCSSAFALVRHGQTDWNATGRLQGHTDLSLNEAGVSQADAAGRALAGPPWDVIVTSPLQRAQQTARKISRNLGIEGLLIEPGFIEQAFGVAEGMVVEEARARWPDDHFPNGETRAQVARRVADTWTRFIADYANSRVIIVCHGVVIRCLTEQLIGLDPGIVPNGSVTVFTRPAGSWVIE